MYQFMSFFIEHDRLSSPDNIKQHLENVYHHLFPSSTWDSLPNFSLDGLVQWLPPGDYNSVRIGFRYNFARLTGKTPFILRLELPKHHSKIGMKFLLTDIILEHTDFNPKRSNIFNQIMEDGDRYGGVAYAAIGILKPQFYLLPEPAGPSCYDVRCIRCLGVENNQKPRAIIYFE
jgi:hypothetical protein